jgi:hypothetical protein
MCKAKPGRRCPKCRSTAVISQQNILRRLSQRLKDADPGTDTYAALQRECDYAARELIMRQADLASTAEAREEYAAELSQLLAEDVKHPKIQSTARLLVEGRLMDAYRREQMGLMPTKPNHPSAQQAYKDLGDARFDLARYRVRMDLNGADTAVWEHWSKRHFDAAQRANIAAAKLGAIETSGDPSAWSNMTPADRLAARKQLAETTDFSTPVAPRTIEDVLHDYADREEGHDPIPDELARHAHLPFSQRETQLLEQAAPQDPPKTPIPDTPKQERDRQQRARAQSRRRRLRRTSAKALLTKARRTNRRLQPDQLLGPTASKSGLLKDGEKEGQAMDVTGIMLLLELWAKK